MAKQESALVKKKKFFDIEIPMLDTNIQLIGNSLDELNNSLVKIDLTRQLKGKSVDAVFKIIIENNKPSVIPKKIILMPYFIRRMIRKRISYVEDSFSAKTSQSLVNIKPFLITRKRVSRAIRKTLRNSCKNWIDDYLKEKTDEELFEDIFSNRLQKQLSLRLKKIYPLSLCEIRVLEIKRDLTESEKQELAKTKKIRYPEEEKKKKEKEEKQEKTIQEQIEEQEVEEAEQEIKKTQEKAAELEEVLDEIKEAEQEKPVKEKKPRKPRTKKKKQETSE